MKHLLILSVLFAVHSVFSADYLDNIRNHEGNKSASYRGDSITYEDRGFTLTDRGTGPWNVIMNVQRTMFLLNGKPYRNYLSKLSVQKELMDDYLSYKCDEAGIPASAPNKTMMYYEYKTGKSHSSPEAIKYYMDVQKGGSL